jgi:hypothetical protein
MEPAQRTGSGRAASAQALNVICCEVVTRT